MVGHDGLGRRIYDYREQGSNSDGRRDYTYLPNGQLGGITGTTAAGNPYALSLRYDAEGRPLTISYSSGDSYELFWDDAGRLIAVAIAGSVQVRWHYHYLGNTLVAATREMADGTGGVKRFWPITDERGLISRMVDEVGATYWQARWNAEGAREMVGTAQPAMWVPFGLAGQLILDGTEASSAVGSTARPSIALNQLRAYDPLLGAFLQPDAADQASRLLPEGYLYGRGDPIGHVDRSGARAKRNTHGIDKLIPKGWELHYDNSCAAKQKEFEQATTDAINAVWGCPDGQCGGALGENVRRQWIFAMLTGTYFCPTEGHDVTATYGAQRTETWSVYPSTDKHYPGMIQYKKMPALAATLIVYQGNTLGGRLTAFGTNFQGSCLAQTLAHEALHGVVATIPAELAQLDYASDGSHDAGVLYLGRVPANSGAEPVTWGQSINGGFHAQIPKEEAMVERLDKCVTCAKK